MARLYLHCAICGRRQADGLLSGAAWGRIELPAGTSLDHPAVHGSTARACPTCIGSNPDWESRALTSLGLTTGYGFPAPAV